MLFTSPAFAQLTPDCTVSILNRSAEVDINGNWSIANGPTGLGCTGMKRSIYTERLAGCSNSSDLCNLRSIISRCEDLAKKMSRVTDLATGLFLGIINFSLEPCP